jgi:hypothetical protein
MVHFNTRYGQDLNSSMYWNIDETELKNRDNIAVLGVFFKIQKEHNEKLWPFIHGICAVEH